MNLFFASTSDTLTLYWDKPEGVGADARYEVALSDGARRTVTRTHCTFENLTPNTTYIAEVRCGDTCGTIVTATTAVRPRVDVTLPPYGAVGDGATLNTGALQRAIDACPPGGEVFLPAGTFLTGALRLHSDMALHLTEGATLQGTADPKDYLPKIWSRFEGTERECYASLLNLGELDRAGGYNCRNVLIYGQGTIRGGGQPLALAIIESERERLKDYIAALGDKVKECENDNTIPGRARGRLINLSNCENVRVTGLTLQEGASWNVHMIYSRGIVTDHCVFRSEGVWNGDGWDPDSSEDCTLFASEFFTGDDAVAIKSGKNPEGNLVNRPTRHIRIFDCLSHAGHGIAIGSEMSGGVEDVRVWDCDLEHSAYGIQIKGTKKRGGYVRNIHAQDCAVPRVMVCAVTYNDDGEGAPEPPEFSDFHFERLRMTGWAREYWQKEEGSVAAIDLSGFDDDAHAAQNIAFVDCELPKDAQVRMTRCKNVTIGVKSAE